MKDRLIRAQKTFANVQNYFQLLIHVQIHWGVCEHHSDILGLIGNKSPMTQAPANIIRPSQTDTGTMSQLIGAELLIYVSVT